MKTILIAAGGLVTNERNELLMIFRREHWDLPKGKLDEGESIEACAVREVQEETGLKNISLGKFAGITLHNYFDQYLSKNVTKETHWYAMKAGSDETLVPQTNEDITAIKWVALNSLQPYLENTYDNIREIIHKATELQLFSQSN